MSFLQNVTGWYFSKKSLPYWCVLIVDCCLVFLAGLVSSYLQVGGLQIAERWWQTVAGLCCCLPCFIISFHFFHTYQGIIRFSSYYDLYRVSKATLCGCLASALLGMIIRSKALVFPNFESAIILFIISTFLLWVIRLFVKAGFESFNLDSAIPVAIYGTKAGGIALANSIRSIKDKRYRLKAFISDDTKLRNVNLMGRPVLFNNADVVESLTRLGVKVLLVSPLKTQLFTKNQPMVDAVTSAGIKIMMMSVEAEWDGKSELSLNQLHNVEIEDLLPRDKIEIDMEAIGRLLADKRILITGAAGSIGSEMVRQVAAFRPAELILIDQAETPMHDIRLMMTRRFPHIKTATIVTSITNQTHMEQLFAQHRPHFVFHAAAYKHVPMMEDNPAIAVQNNIAGTRIIADLAVKYGTTKFVMISTDKAVNPTNVMGCSKRICEIYCQALNQAIQNGRVKGHTQFVTTRFGNVLGSNGSVIPLFKEQIKRGGPITVTHPDIIRYFMLIPEACKLVLEAGTMGKGGEIFVFDMGKPVKIIDLAKRMIKLSGAQNVDIKFTGLRDGEKLFEEVLTADENTIPTVHPKIMVAKVRPCDYDTALRNEQRLLAASQSFDDMQIVRIMKEIVPEYKSNASKYEILDK